MWRSPPSPRQSERRRQLWMTVTLVLILTAATLMPGLLTAYAAPSGQRGDIYIVQRGDTLSSIAARFGVTPAELAQANGLRNLNFVWVGQQLIIPGSPPPPPQPAPGVHVVQRGETLAGIAARYGTTVAELARLNGLGNANFIWVGQQLRIPGGEPPTPEPSPGFHIVGRGETLAGIAARYGTTIEELARINGLRNTNFIWVGQRLTLPTPTPTPGPLPTATPVPPTATRIPPSATATATATLAPPTATRIPPSATATATATLIPPTATRIPPSATATATATLIPPTATRIPPSATATATPTLIPPTATATPAPPTATPSPTRPAMATPGATPSPTAVPPPTPTATSQPTAIPQPTATAGPAAPTATATALPLLEATIHIVQPGDTLASIAAHYGTTVAALTAANKLENPNLIWVGQQLKVNLGGTPFPEPTAAPAPSAGRWIDINLSRQWLTAYEGNTPVFSTPISGGLPATPTVVGTFAIYIKLVSQTMTGPGYWLPDVPYVMYFYGSYAIHGAYWHNNFGRPMSHGCVNVPVPASAWLFGWASIGTPVVIHW